MITLTKSNANGRCRTCLCKLIKDENCSQDDVSGGNILQTKFVDIKTNKELQEMLDKYVVFESESNVVNDQSYPQYICMECLKHLQAFETFRNKALESARKLYRVFSEDLYIHKIELNDDGLECKNNIEEQFSENVKDVDIFNLFLKDSLMETEAILLEGPSTNNDFASMDPDPFQNMHKQDIRRKPKARKAKGKVIEVLPNNKSITRKSKKSKDNNVENVENFNIETKTEPLKKDDEGNVDDDIGGWQDNSFPDHDDSSDNEVLSNIILHSKKTVKERKQNAKNSNAHLHKDNSFSNHDFNLKLSENVHTVEAEKCMIISGKCDLDAGKETGDRIKSEPDSDSLSSENDFNAKTKSDPKAMKTEKKKRHCILNSGRKKGLANRYKCEQCQHKFGHKLTLEAHIRKVHEGQKKAFKCEMCDKAYSFIGGLSTHIRDVHERKQDSYDCSVPGCDKKYSNFITLQRHVRFKHLNMEITHQYVCEQCGATFKQSSNLRYHMKTRHPTEEDLKRKEQIPKDRLECEECKKSFHSQYTLKYHKLRVHADEKKFECKICGRRVAKQFMLDSHMLVHSDQKLACKFCGREFVRKYQVEAHIRAVHQKLKPFQCPHCSESFASRKTLRHHIYIHTGEKPYVCDICGQAYRQPTCLKNHRKTHTKLSANDVPTTITANRSFLNNFIQNSEDAIINSG